MDEQTSGQQGYTEDTRTDATAAAYLRGYLQYSPQEIADFLGWSRHQVDLRLEAAVKLGMLVDRPIAKLSDARLREAERRLGYLQQGRQLIAKLTGTGGEIQLNWIGIAPSADDPAECRRRLAAVAARRLWEHALRGTLHYAGIAWGRTVRSVVEAAKKVSVERLEAQQRLRRSIEVVPIVGDLLQTNRSYAETANSLSEAFAVAFGGKVTATLPIPAFQPRPFLEEGERQRSREQVERDQEGVRRFLESIPGYQLIYGASGRESNRFIDRMDCLLCSVGTWNDELAFYNLSDHVLEEEKEELKDCSLGDLCGLFVAREGADGHADPLIMKVNNRFYGPSLTMFRDIAGRSREGAGPDGKQPSSPGVFVCAWGKEKEKASLIERIVRNGYASELCLDEKIADALGERLGIPKSSDFRAKALVYHMQRIPKHI